VGTTLVVKHAKSVGSFDGRMLAPKRTAGRFRITEPYIVQCIIFTHEEISQSLRDVSCVNGKDVIVGGDVDGRKVPKKFLARKWVMR